MFSLQRITNRFAPLLDERRLLAPEVVQTSAMDCGPAALKCLLEGYGIRVSYGRLREACQTDVDGTSIDTLEDLARQLGLDALQTMTPLDHLLLDEAGLLPALVVTALPNGLTHFVVVWRVHGQFVQVMDPGVGRRWLRRPQFLQEVYRHQFAIAASEWRAWAGTAAFRDPLAARLTRLGILPAEQTRLLAAVQADPTWRAMATLDATIRLVDGIVEGGGLLRGPEATALVSQLFVESQVAVNPFALLPALYWTVQPILPRVDDEQPEQLLLRGAVLVQVIGRQEEAAPVRPVPAEPTPVEPTPAEPTPAEPDVVPPERTPLPPDLTAALGQTPDQPEWEILRVLRADGLLTPALLALALLLSIAGVTWEAVLLRGLINLGQRLTAPGQQRLLLGMVFALVFLLLAVELPISATLLRIGRRLETRLRVRLLAKIPRLGDRYFHSRLTSDMAQRAHELRYFSDLPELAVRFLRLGLQLLFTTVGIFWLSPGAAVPALLALLCSVGLALLAQPLLIEQDLRLRTHLSALSRFYLDALLGLTPARAHSAERTLRREHEGLLVAWVRASYDFYRSGLLVRAMAALCGYGFAAWIVYHYVATGNDASGVLLLLYWVLNLPVLGQSLLESAQQYPAQRNRVLRLLEPLGAPEEKGDKETGREGDKESGEEVITPSPPHPLTQSPDGVAIQCDDVTVLASGHTILAGITLTVQPGEHVAIVGPSGAGKSSLVGLLLGWHRPAQGQVRVDGLPLDGDRLAELRRATAWVDPAIQLWNRTLLENLTYGADGFDAAAIGRTIETAHLAELLAGLPSGLQSRLGEGGGLVSGGEGQRVRLGRALLRPAVRLAILDEPFRGLDRTQRHALLTAARHHWRTSTLLCITHDVGETATFDRVLVLEEGRIVEDGAPSMLAAHPHSRYAALVAAEETVQRGLWAGVEWRRLQLAKGVLHETVAAPSKPARPKRTGAKRKENSDAV